MQSSSYCYHHQFAVQYAILCIFGILVAIDPSRTQCAAFLVTSPYYRHPLSINQRHQVALERLVLSQMDPEASAENAATTTNAALPPSTNPDDSTDDDMASAVAAASKSASVATMTSQENKRVLIEELGYRRRDVDRLKFDLALTLVERQVRCPESGEIPEAWFRSENELMMEKLEQESKYPLKLPLIGVSLVLFGKGFGDALVTLIKVSTSFPGASLTEEFLGVPVLLIDAVCTVLGASLAWWTWTNMKG
jgi:hypothetical protein